MLWLPILPLSLAEKIGGNYITTAHVAIKNTESAQALATAPTKNRHLRLLQANSMTSAARLCHQAVVKWPRSGLDTDLLLKNSSESWSPALCLCRYCYVQRAVRAVLRCYDKRSTSMHSPKEILWPYPLALFKHRAPSALASPPDDGQSGQSSRLYLLDQTIAPST